MYRKILSFFALVLFYSVTLAQVRPNNNLKINSEGIRVIKQIPKQPVAMSDFKNTAQAKQRLATLGPNFSGYDKSISYSDGSKINISLVKNPSFGGQGADIRPIVTPVGNVPVHGAAPIPPAPNGYTCNTSLVVVKANSTSFLNGDYSAQASHIYPGAIYTADNFFNGSYREETAPRNTLTIGTDNYNMNGPSYADIANPNGNSIHNAITQLFNNASSTAGTGSLQYQTYSYNNAAELNIKVTAGGSGYGFTASNTYSNQNNQKHIYMTVDARKSMFTITTAPPSNGFFQNPSDEAKPNLMFIGSVTYGVRILANIDIVLNSQSAADEFKGAFNGDGFEANVNFNYLSNSQSVSSTINAYVVGGPSSAATMAFDKSELQSQIQNILAGATYANARPISYTLYDMAGETIGIQSATDQFVSQVCVPNNKPINIVSSIVSITSGQDGKDHDTHYTYSLFDGHNSLVARYQNNSNNSEFKANSINSDQLNVSGTHSMVDFVQSGGGSFTIDIDPNGHDTWNINNLTLTINFSDGQTKTITWQRSDLSQNNKHHSYFFDAAFHPL